MPIQAREVQLGRFFPLNGVCFEGLEEGVVVTRFRHRLSVDGIARLSRRVDERF